MPSSNNVVHLHHGEAQPDQLPAIAVVGFSLKFPQDATSPASFWKLLEEKRCVASDWPRDRISLDAFYHADNDRRDTVSSCFLAFGDHGLMGRRNRCGEDTSSVKIWQSLMRRSSPLPLPRPWQWILNSACCWKPHTERWKTVRHGIDTEEVVADKRLAGIPMEQTFGSKTGVYAGSMTNDYQIISTKDEEDLPSYGAVGTSASMLANRLSWFFNFTGPSVSLDTACSSSLMALDLACQGLRTGESSMVSS